ncbi:hypothetical protein ACJMK2_035876 [Sinanodonta woodiana]|uniref:Protein phosphatase 1 regulatory subunit 36 n=1 Tax=Sinanodonta woodiana TaxID=1069815 RepID=A0ABD3WIT2_SINWO
MAKVASPNSELTPMSGKYVWKEDSSGKGCLEFVSNNPNADKQEKRKRAKEGKRNDRVASGLGKSNAMKGRGQQRLNPPKSPKPGKQSESHSIVTLDKIKAVALNLVSEMEEIAPTFEVLFDTPEFNNFLLHLLSYFHCFFEKLHAEHKLNISTYIEPSLSEKKAHADACVKLELTQKLLGQSYCMLVLGLGISTPHHMDHGESRVSSTYKDRDMYETLYSFCTYFVWVTFRRKEFESVKKEVGRMLRSDTFNPAIRVKNAPDEQKKDKDDGEEKKELQREKKLTPAEYRRLHTKRPAIKSIINQRSPAVVAILPSPKEEANWLFRMRHPLSPNSMGKLAGEKDVENLEQELKHEIVSPQRKNFKVGILGEPMSLFNPITLHPLGTENEDEDNEGEEGEQKQPDDACADKTHQPDQGLSRQQTAVSMRTEAFSDDE